MFSHVYKLAQRVQYVRLRVHSITCAAPSTARTFEMLFSSSPKEPGDTVPHLEPPTAREANEPTTRGLATKAMTMKDHQRVRIDPLRRVLVCGTLISSDKWPTQGDPCITAFGDTIDNMNALSEKCSLTQRAVPPLTIASSAMLNEVLSMLQGDCYTTVLVEEDNLTIKREDVGGYVFVRVWCMIV
jgi:hypothetical protein